MEAANIVLLETADFRNGDEGADGAGDGDGLMGLLAFLFFFLVVDADVDADADVDVDVDDGCGDVVDWVVSESKGVVASNV